MPGTFPALRTGAITQYPLERSSELKVEASEFLDFSRQAYRDTAAVRKSWTITLDLLDSGEVARLRAFFEQQQGRFGVFTFVDPWDNSSHPNCSFADDALTQLQEGEMRNRISLTVYEHA